MLQEALRQAAGPVAPSPAGLVVTHGLGAVAELAATGAAETAAPPPPLLVRRPRRRNGRLAASRSIPASATLDNDTRWDDGLVGSAAPPAAATALQPVALDATAAAVPPPPRLVLAAASSVPRGGGAARPLPADGDPNNQGEPVLVTACDDNALKMWRMPTFDKRGILASRVGHSDVVRCIAKGPGNSFFTGGMDRNIFVWEFAAD